MEVAIVFGFLIYGLVCGSFAAGIANTKGREPWSWFFCGLLFGIIVLLAAGFVETKAVEEEMRRWRETQERAKKEHTKV